MPTFGSYAIYVLSQSIPHLESPWTQIEVPDKTFTFKRNTNESTVFSISGYCTITNGEGLNTALGTTPSGTFVDGYGHSYVCLVDSYEFSYAPPIMDRMNFSITGRVISND
jgi:hypothetical protein